MNRSRADAGGRDREPPRDEEVPEELLIGHDDRQLRLELLMEQSESGELQRLDDELWRANRDEQNRNRQRIIDEYRRVQQIRDAGYFLDYRMDRRGRPVPPVWVLVRKIGEREDGRFISRGSALAHAEAQGWPVTERITVLIPGDVFEAMLNPDRPTAANVVGGWPTPKRTDSKVLGVQFEYVLTVAQAEAMADYLQTGPPDCPARGRRIDAALSRRLEDVETAPPQHQSEERNTGYGRRIFLKEAEWRTYRRRSPAGRIKPDKRARCEICGKEGDSVNPLQQTRRIGFEFGVIDLALTPDFLDGKKNVVTAHRSGCSNRVKLDADQALVRLRELDVAELPNFLGRRVHLRWNWPAAP